MELTLETKLALLPFLDARTQKALAVERYRRFVELWKNCDLQLQPLTINAKERIARLQ